MSHSWDPQRYLTYADERGRPFVDLLARVGASAPRTLVDLGCGPGNLTQLLSERWPNARVNGLDSSTEMIAEARGSGGADIEQVAPSGWFAFQVPGNFDEPSHTIRTEIAGRAPYAELTRDVAVPSSHDPRDYFEALASSGMRVDAWETTYLHVLTREDPVFTWVSGTGARPTLQSLPPELRADFEAEFKQRLAEAYPVRDGRVLLPFRRIFVVASKS